MSTVLEIFGEYEAATGLVNRRDTACFLWAMWSHIAQRQPVRQMLHGLSDDVLKRMIESAREAPDPDMARMVHRRASAGEEIVYLMEQMLRIQHSVAHSLPSTRHTGEGSLPALARLGDAAQDFFILRRPAAYSPPDVLKHRHVPRMLFPDLRIIPERIAGSLRVDLVTLANRKRSAAPTIRTEPRVFKTPAGYEVATDNAEVGDVRFRLVRLASGADERRDELIEEALRIRTDAHEQDLMLLWPELSVDQQVVDAFLHALQDSPTEKPVGAARLAIPGTFSAEDAPRMLGPYGSRTWPHTPNRTAVVDVDTGTPIFWQDKVRGVTPMLGERRYVEAIIPASLIKVGVADWGTFCIMICRDFVDGDYPLIEHLDIDYVFVPSMGEPNTERAWREMSKRLQRRWGGRSALAMQAAPHPEEWVSTPGDGDAVAVS